VPQDRGGLAFGPGQQLEVIGWRHRQHAAMPPLWRATRYSRSDGPVFVTGLVHHLCPARRGQLRV